MSDSLTIYETFQGKAQGGQRLFEVAFIFWHPRPLWFNFDIRPFHVVQQLLSFYITRNMVLYRTAASGRAVMPPFVIGPYCVYDKYGTFGRFKFIIWGFQRLIIIWRLAKDLWPNVLPTGPKIENVTSKNTVNSS